MHTYRKSPLGAVSIRQELGCIIGYPLAVPQKCIDDRKFFENQSSQKAKKKKK